MSTTLKGFVQICAHTVVDGNGSHKVKWFCCDVKHAWCSETNLCVQTTAPSNDPPWSPTASAVYQVENHKGGLCVRLCETKVQKMEDSTVTPHNKQCWWYERVNICSQAGDAAHPSSPGIFNPNTLLSKLRMGHLGLFSPSARQKK